ncbi:hypothetical protein [Bifidobacterium myosotis]|uniref:Uncharacterized protein n=1 Tax=Bifidobacterium myosotis TaxID=1630166 RepID=A0A5M9ZKR0_9BIFI|nr:hypothetical protein [Bifidobacterium myosotis]KAA8828181.1 hypothetical protein EMO91_07000 [Bifidobacterium myosotis]
MSPKTPTLAAVAAEYLKAHHVERQSQALRGDRPVELTVIQNKWAARAGREPLDVDHAPEAVIRAVETTREGRRLFARARESAHVVVYPLREAIR